MSWWNVRGSDVEVTGDQPADILTGALRELALKRSRSGKKYPAVGELLATLDELVAGANERVVLEDDQGSTYVSTLTEASPDLLPGLREALVGIRHAYEDRWNRQPSQREILATFEFVLGYRSDRYLDHSTGVARLHVASTQ